jgi:hypothetical protein
MQREYLLFLKEMVGKYAGNVGMLLAIARGVYTYSSSEELILSNEAGIGVPAVLASSLSAYLFRTDC